MAKHEGPIQIATETVDNRIGTEILNCYQVLAQLTDLIQSEKSPKLRGHLNNMLNSAARELEYWYTFGIDAQNQNH